MKAPPFAVPLLYLSRTFNKTQFFLRTLLYARHHRTQTLTYPAGNLKELTPFVFSPLRTYPTSLKPRRSRKNLGCKENEKERKNVGYF